MLLGSCQVGLCVVARLMSPGADASVSMAEEHGRYVWDVVRVVRTCDRNWVVNHLVGEGCQQWLEAEFWFWCWCRLGLVLVQDWVSGKL